ncbi:MAG TPA: NAD(P)-dependent oxidoreductase [Terriglobia bacterium]|nr:NAD(P)-dependent oxidoreductase [Terriglobia bacterium]
MNILVTGGLGAIGTVLVEELRRRGHGVWLCDLSHHHDPQYIRCDVAEYRQLERIFDHHRFEMVYHLAAEFGRWNGEDFYETLWRSNVIGTKNVIRLQEKHRFRHVFFSTSEVYGDWDGVMREDVMDLYEVRQLNDYAITKWAGEMQVMNSAQMAGTETVRVRLFNVYGPGEKYSNYRSVNCLFCYRALHDLPYTVYLQHHRCATYVTDAVRTLANIADTFIPGEVYNIGSTEYRDIKTVSDLVLRHLGKDDRRVTYERLEPFTTRDKKVDVGKAERDLGHCPRVPLAVGLARTLEWMRRYYAPPEKLSVIPVVASQVVRTTAAAHSSAKHAACRAGRRSQRHGLVVGG